MMATKKTPGRWLFKEEPSGYNFTQLEKDGSTKWTGVNNALAKLHLRKVRTGDRVLYYHTGKEKAIVGEMRVAAVEPDAANPLAVIVTVVPVRRWEPAVTLAQIKADPLFANWELLRISRLSVMPVSPEQWQRLEELCEAGGLE